MSIEQVERSSLGGANTPAPRDKSAGMFTLRVVLFADERPLERAELEVQTSLYNINVRCDANAGCGYAADCRSTGQSRRVVVVEPVEVVLYETCEPVQEGIFTADAHRPARLRHAHGRGCGRHGDLKAEVTLHPGATASDVSQKAIHSKTYTTSNRGQRLELRMVRQTEGSRRRDSVRAIAIDVCPIIVALNPEYPGTNLIIAACLRAAERAACRVAPEVSESRVSPVGVGPNATDVATHIASGPGEYRYHPRGHGIQRRRSRKIGRAGGPTEQRNDARPCN